jgi:dihydrofolate synthase/folylpolyglutamate synthase
MTYPDAVAFLYSLGRFGIKLGLRNIERLLAALGEPQRAYPAVHVAGSNGKGSTAALLAAILGAAGHRVGLYTSPHLLDFTERIRVDGRAATQDEILDLTREVKAAADATFGPAPTHADPGPGTRDPGPAARAAYPTFFEFTTAMAFLHFARRGVGVAAVEVGLGGRFDATNVLDPLVAVVTNISLEHTDYLGRTVAAIAAEKSGIVKPGGTVVTAAEDPEALGVIEATCRERGAALHRVQAEVALARAANGLEGQRFAAATHVREYGELWIPLLGRHQVLNAATAILAAERLEARGLAVGAEAVRRGLAGARWPGRLQIVGRDPLTILDGAHNPAGALALRDFLQDRRATFDRLFLVFGVLRDKDWEGMLSVLGPLVYQAILTRPEGERAALPWDLAAADRFCAKLDIREDVGDAIALARAGAAPRDAVLATGSLFTVAAALRALGFRAID